MKGGTPIILSLTLLALKQSWAALLVGPRKEKCLPMKGVEKTDFGLAMHGYDPFKADNLAKEGNPGIMNGEIFDYKCSLNNGYRNFISFRSDLNCEASMNTETFHNVHEYSKAMSGSESTSYDVSVEASGSAFGFSAEGNAKYASSRDGSHSKAVQGLKSGEGEVHVATATCFTHDVSINTFSRVKFSQNFLNALLDLNKTIGHANKQMDVFIPFMKTFGTHYIKKAELGASLTYQKVFEKASRSKAAQMTRSECMSESAGGCVSASYKGAVAKVSAKACVNAAMNGCQASKGSSQSEIEDSVGSFSIVSRGSRPKELDKWLDSKFEPIPIKITALPLYDLLTTRNLAQDPDYGFETAIDAEQMRGIFIKMYKMYCLEVLLLSPIQCARNMTGCALLGDCLYSQTCVDDPAQLKGFRCVDKPHNGTVRYCRGLPVLGDLTPSHRYRNKTFDQCLSSCVQSGGTYLTIHKDKDPDNFGTGDCWCFRGNMTLIDTEVVSYRTMPVGKCNECHGVFRSGETNALEEQRFGKGGVQECADYCSRKGAGYITIRENSANVTSYHGDCWCEFGHITAVNTETSGAFRTAPALVNCN